MQILSYGLMHFCEYLLWSASFGIAAIAYNTYLVWREKKSLITKHNIPHLLILCSIAGGGYINFVSNDKVVELQAKTATMEEHRKVQKKYGRWAKLTASGFSLDGTDLYVHHTMKPAFLRTPEGQISPTDIDCGDPGLTTLKKTIDRYPDFPFSYVYISACYGENKNLEWRMYAEEALRILEKTTQVIDHHRHHDRAYELIRDWLQSDTLPSAPRL